MDRKMDKYIKLEDAIDLFWTVDPENNGDDGCTVVLKCGSYDSNEIETLLSELPTIEIAPPNEPPPCYQPDGDGCAYQCYDGDDEPIDKCKECPLCYSDKQRHHTPPTEPLTQADLNEMYLNEVWLGHPDGSGETALVVNGKIYSTSSLEGAGLDLEDYIMGETLDAPTGTYKVYRRPPEGEV